MKFAREKQREESALHNQPALHGAAPTYRTQIQTHFTEQYPYSKSWLKHHNPQLSKLCLTCVRTSLLNTWITEHGLVPVFAPVFSNDFDQTMNTTHLKDLPSPAIPNILLHWVMR